MLAGASFFYDGPVIDYVRPPVLIEEFLDEHGLVIPYGSRWADNDGDGPDDTYSVTRHPERFQPFVDVARAIVDHLVATYDVRREDPDERTVVLRPVNAQAAPLSFVFTPFPSVQVTAGARTRIDVACGCDHCDEGVLDLVAELEESISAVVAGQLTEWPTGFELRHADGTEWQSGGQETAEPAEMQGSPTRYGAWTLRSR